jgi:hypothetical protein
MGTAVQMNGGCGYEEGGADVGKQFVGMSCMRRMLYLLDTLACCVRMYVSGTECGACSR